MFSKLSVTVASVLFILAAAMPNGAPPPPVTPPNSDQCCNSVMPSNSTEVSLIASLLGIDLSGLDVPVGVQCGSVTGLGGWNDDCTGLGGGGMPLTCDAPEEEWGGLIALNCFPRAIA
ncbi:hypothetical protein C8R45DRAFT_995512 [Mycena sanguinolenta]|nr:hypothetical protein C8R45DRAFT_995512 [Mycena sanguinolenta]